MAGRWSTGSVVGTSEVIRILNMLDNNDANNLMRAAIHGIAGKASKEIKKAAPTGRRNFLRDVIRPRRRKVRKGLAYSDVTAKRGNAGNAETAFYWRFVEYGQGYGPAQPFVNPVRRRYETIAPEEVDRMYLSKLAKMTRRRLKAQAKANERRAARPVGAA